MTKQKATKKIATEAFAKEIKAEQMYAVRSVFLVQRAGGARILAAAHQVRGKESSQGAPCQRRGHNPEGAILYRRAMIFVHV